MIIMNVLNLQFNSTTVSGETIIAFTTKVGVSYMDHMDDDAPKVDRFSHKCYQAFSSPLFQGESLRMTYFCKYVYFQ